MTRPDDRVAARYLGAFAACVVLCLLSIAFVDRAVSTWAHTLGRPPAYEWLTHLIDPFVPIASITLAGLAIAALFGWRPGALGRTVLAVCLALIIVTVMKDQLKYLFGRTWPETWTDHNPSWISNGVYRFEPLHGGRGWLSFPSGHMATMTAPCTVLWLRLPRVWRWLWAALVLAVAIGLLGSDFHFVADMIAGTFVGAACGIGANTLVNALRFVRQKTTDENEFNASPLGPGQGAELTPQEK